MNKATNEDKPKKGDDLAHYCYLNKMQLIHSTKTIK